MGYYTSFYGEIRFNLKLKKIIEHVIEENNNGRKRTCQSGNFWNLEELL